jgi:hypothetical protein
VVSLQVGMPLLQNFFCKISVQEIEAGNRPHGTLTVKGYANLVEKFVDQAGRPYT